MVTQTDLEVKEPSLESESDEDLEETDFNLADFTDLASGDLIE